MGYAFLNKKKIHGVFNEPVKYNPKQQEEFPLLQAEGTKVELGLVVHLIDGNSMYPVYLEEEVGSIRGSGTKWKYTDLDGNESEMNYRSRRAASMAVAEAYLAKTEER